MKGLSTDGSVLPEEKILQLRTGSKRNTKPTCSYLILNNNHTQYPSIDLVQGEVLVGRQLQLAGRWSLPLAAQLLHLE
jgi:hypothetical protein